MKTADELNAAFAADPMIEKARAIAAELLTLGDAMKSEEVLARLKATREDATRILRDKADIYVDGGDLIQLGQHRFAVNKQTFDLTMLPRTGTDGTPRLALHLTGTEYFEDVDDPGLNALRDLWDDTLPSEDARVARVEFLACTILFDALAGRAGAAGLEQLEMAHSQEGQLLALVADVARSRYDEGYERGVHDADAAQILGALLSLRLKAGKLAHAPKARALGALYWARVDEAARAATAARVRGTARLLLRFQDSGAARDRVLALAAEMLPRLQSLVPGSIVVDESDARAAAAALVDEIGSVAGEASLVLSGDAKLLCDELFGSRARVVEVRRQCCCGRRKCGPCRARSAGSRGAFGDPNQAEKSDVGVNVIGGGGRFVFSPSPRHRSQARSATRRDAAAAAFLHRRAGTALCRDEKSSQGRHR